MANLDNAQGFRFYRDLTSGDCPQVRHFDVTASTELFRGQLVKIDQTSGHLIACNGAFASDADANGSVVGVSAQYLVSTASVVQDHPVILAHTAEFLIQDDASGSVSTRLNWQTTYLNDVWFQFSDNGTNGVTDGSSALGNSLTELDTGASSGDAGYMKVTDWHRVANNAFGNNMDLIVRINPDCFRAGPFALAQPA